MNVAVIKYNAGNIYSMQLALQRLGITPLITANPQEIYAADKVIFPGVGEASSAMDYLRAAGLDQVITGLKQPFLGVCLGLQLLCRHTAENDTACLGIFDEAVRRFPPEQKVPHMGWNSLQFDDHWLFRGVRPGDYVYFVHSYFAETGDRTIAKTDYIRRFSCALERDNYCAVQFHPEKSGAVGETILRNFLER